MNPVAIRELQDALHAALDKCDVSSDDASGAVKSRLLFLQHLHLVRHCHPLAPALSPLGGAQLGKALYQDNPSLLHLAFAASSSLWAVRYGR
jgi:hypothetical protein